MKKDEDFRIQEILDKKMKGIADVSYEMTNIEDLKAYELIYDQLAKEPVEHLSISFKANVLRRIEMEKKKTSDIMFYWLLGVVSLIGILTMISIFFIFKDAFAPAWNIIDRFKGFIVLGIAGIIAFNIVEKKLSKVNI
ncbi:hypothetical protein AY601_2764 [Pedobacter cryoconitis]|uniref:Uncharacterized protein n=1 Tax=Pedobacter cryoconitis TaxID=188932 RepID=A0A127VEH0_9SPHI|nr:hypothetical protein [Pedobacter cryoconitis]AMP99647.1 hypothetical protein AY601_2764 [Pedobacter cryoconitis]